MTTITTELAGKATGGNGLHNLTGVLDALRRGTAGQESVDVAHVMDAFAGRLVGPLLIVPALLLISPLGAVPFLPAVLAVFVLLVAAQAVAARGRPWIPDWLARCAISRKKLMDGMDAMRPWARRVDRLIKPRATVLVRGAMRRVLAASACVLALLVFPLAPIPFAVQLPAWGLVAIGLSLIAHDGALAAIGLALGAGAVGLTVWVLV